MHVRGIKVKVIPGTPYCYSYNCLFEFQQIWVSVLQQRQNKLKGSKSKSQQGQYILFFFFTFGIKPGCFILNFITEKKQTKKSLLKWMCLRSEFSLIFLTEQSSTIQRQSFFIVHLCTVRLNPAGQNQRVNSFSMRSSTRTALAVTHRCKDLLCQTLTKVSPLTSLDLGSGFIQQQQP